MHVGAQRQRLVRHRRQRLAGLALHACLDLAHHALGFLGLAVGHQPARAFRQETAQEQHDAAQHAADDESRAPADLRRHDRGVQHHQRAQRAQRRAQPEAAVHHQVGEAAPPRRDHSWMVAFTAAYSPPMPAPVISRNSAKEAKFHDRPQAMVATQIDQHGDAEQFLAPQPVGQPAEEQRAGDRPDQIGAGRRADLLRRQMQARAFRQRAGQRADDRHLQPVQDPRDPQRE